MNKIISLFLLIFITDYSLSEENHYSVIVSNNLFGLIFNDSLKSNIALFDNAKCNISNWKVTYRKMLKNWRHLNKTSYMKEVLQQLKLGEKNVFDYRQYHLGDIQITYNSIPLFKTEHLDLVPALHIAKSKAK